MPTTTRSRELTLAELVVLRAAAAGRTAAETAAQVDRSYETVKTHRKRVLAQLEARNMTHAVAIAYSAGILGAPKLPVFEEIREGQLRAFHAKAAALDAQLHDERGTAKRHVLIAAAEKFERSIESVTDLSSREASWALDYLEELLTS